ncbi:substrate-binding and VWA domain-containing protein [Micromonospora sp. DSM 115977]|uniref:Substrate-binding and VWA domain-containing protein n=1 Tax=Micromonospora reichwaldensis TaxID=3075516 RepID=A0ABU2X016_9ACTN|nr:substrate-binding and VWA domain-containing protein [Micromonospora sp. DSM 115977]MDT0530981.1 substrate-binding and VWA domain-containing protein [Micromonospora sp. DSM 115977]
MVSGRPTARPWLPYAAAIVAGSAVIAAAYLIARPASDAVCTPLEVSSSIEKDVLLGELAERYNKSDRRTGGRCAVVTVHGLASGASTDALAGDWAVKQPDLPRPQVWLPTSSLWTGQLKLLDEAAGRPAQTPGRYPSIANSPLVIAMPQPKGKHLQQQGPLGWGEVLGSSGRTGWAAFGRPEWGRFSFGKVNPNLSTSGLAATIASYYAAINRASDLTESDVANPAVTQFVRRIEANVSHYSDDIVDLLKDRAEADLSSAGTAAPTDMSAVVTQEELVYQYNEGKLSPSPGEKPRVPLIAMYPKEGTFNLDHPYVVLPSASPEQRDAAADFLKFLQEPPQQQSFSRHGFRDHERNAAGPLIAAVGGRGAENLTYFDPPDPTVVKAILTGWGTLRKKANILVAVDTSGSMNAKIGDRTRFQVATRAATKGFGLLNSEDKVALWSFSSETPQRPKSPYSEEVRLSPFDQKSLTREINNLHVEGGTALYATVRAAHRHMLDHYDQSRINAVVVLTDGTNEYTKDNNLARLLKDVALDPERPIKIFCIAFDEKSDFGTLDRIAKASAGKAFDARDPAKIDDAFVKLVSSF